jgi:hypothetical protein
MQIDRFSFVPPAYPVKIIVRVYGNEEKDATDNIHKNEKKITACKKTHCDTFVGKNGAFPQQNHTRPLLAAGCGNMLKKPRRVCRPQAAKK